MNFTIVVWWCNYGISLNAVTLPRRGNLVVFIIFPLKLLYFQDNVERHLHITVYLKRNAALKLEHVKWIIFRTRTFNVLLGFTIYGVASHIQIIIRFHMVDIEYNCYPTYYFVMDLRCNISIDNITTVAHLTFSSLNLTLKF